MEKPESTGLVRVGFYNLALKLAIAPLSFAFSLLVVKYLSNPPYGLEVFGTWQYIFTLVIGYFTIPADMFSLITSRYSSEGRPVGGLLVINGISGLVSSLIFLILIPYFVYASHFDYPFYFYLSISLILIYYLYRISNAMVMGRTPKKVGEIAAVFQVVRLSSAIIMMFIFNLSIAAVILAYDFGYLVQILLNLLYIKSNLKLDFNLASVAIRKSLPVTVYYLQNVIEASLVWVVVSITGNTITVSYFESAFVLANVITWSQATQTGLIKKLSETKDPSVIETSLKLFSLTSSLFMFIIFAEGKDILFKLRPDYVNSIFALYVISFSNLIRGIYSIFYQSILMKDETLSIEGQGELKGELAKLTRINLLLSIIGVIISILLIEFLKSYPYFIIAVFMSMGLLINSFSMLFTSYRSSRRLYNFKVPREFFIPVLLSFLGIPFSFLIGGKSYLDILVYGVISIGIFSALNLINPYFRQLGRNVIGFIKSMK
jgi:hypothetical protein